MKLSVAFVAAALAASASAHTSLQWFWPEGTMATSVQNCVRQAPNNSPVEDVTSPNIACNVNGNVPAAAVCDVRAGSTVKIEWHHVSREQKSGDDPIAASHHGPISIYLAKVDDAKTTNVNGLEWFKIQEEGLNNGVWAVDRLIDIGTGEWDVRLPANLPNGQYLLRGEIIALHAAGNYPGAQFYIGCVQINVTGGSGNAQFSPRVRFPGAYDGNHPGIKINIWQGVSNYQIPGPAVATAGGSGGSPPPATTQAPPPVTTQAPPPVTTQAPPPSGPAVGKWGQCGGIGYSGSTTCEAGSTCVKLNDYYSQCQ